MTPDKTPDQWDAGDIIEDLKRDRIVMAERRQKPSHGVCPEHSMILESSEHDKTALIWIVRRLDLTNREIPEQRAINVKGMAAIIIGLQAAIEALKAFL